MFVIEVYDITKNNMLVKMENDVPFFRIDELDPGSGYTIEAYTKNIRGPSEKISFHAFTRPLVKTYSE